MDGIAQPDNKNGVGDSIGKLVIKLSQWRLFSAFDGHHTVEQVA